MAGMYFTSEHAYDDALNYDDKKKLLRAYRKNEMKQFHTMNAGVHCNGGIEVFYSYYTSCAKICSGPNKAIEQLIVYPFIWDTNKYRNSVTTNRQVNRWFKDKGISASVNGLRELYEWACARCAGFTHVPDSHECFVDRDGISVDVAFSRKQYYIDSNGWIVCSEVSKAVPPDVYVLDDMYHVDDMA